MKSFLFERDLVTEAMVRWVEKNPRADLSVRITESHLIAQKKGDKDSVDAYENALREMVLARPWDVPGRILVVGG
jgi:hypothetical protein